ncbi:hypothetical protein AB6Q56_04845 [Dechloromonas sp. ARDL1]|uniref:hypothetical protein n=1 Tax=Dechloromonas sp. ARDL1 TaxID=3322121 RepID=UPI003DA7689C
MTTRRQFLQTGLAGGLLLNIAGCTRPSANGRRGTVIAAIAPVMLAGALGQEEREAAIARTVAGVETAIAGLALPVQEEIGELFDLLAFTPTRALAAGLWTDWAQATPGEIRAFLENWRHSRFDLLKSGYAALHDLIFGAWYAIPENWPGIGYPGPPEVK